MSSVAKISKCGTATASLFDEDLMTRLRVRETQIEQGLGVKANNVDELAVKLPTAKPSQLVATVVD